MKEAKDKKEPAGRVRKGVFIPAFAVMAVVVTVGFVNNEGLAKGCLLYTSRCV